MAEVLKGLTGCVVQSHFQFRNDARHADWNKIDVSAMKTVRRWFRSYSQTLFLGWRAEAGNATLRERVKAGNDGDSMWILREWSVLALTQRRPTDIEGAITKSVFTTLLESNASNSF